MYVQELTYRPQNGADHVSRETDMMAVVTIGFVKDAKDHINIQGFNVYHKNRLIKPCWKIWNCTGSDGRGIIGKSIVSVLHSFLQLFWGMHEGSIQ